MPYDTIRYEKQDHVGVVTLDRPDALNAFNRRMEAELSDMWTEMRDDDDVWVAVLTAAGDRAVLRRCRHQGEHRRGAGYEPV